MATKRIYLSSPTMNGTEMQYIQEAFDTNWVAPLGKNVDCFEKEMCEYIENHSETKEEIHALALSAGTAAIHLALIDCGVQQGDIVFCSSLTFSASCNPIVYQGATPVFIDSETNSWNMDPVALKNAFKIYPQAKAVVVVNLYGTPANLEELAAICKEHNVPLVEDAAESLGATYKGKQTGTFGEFGIFSFNGNKIITSSGGGMLISHSEEKIAQAKFLSTQAREKARHYEHKKIGYNYRMSNIVAGIGRGQLTSLDEYIEKKTQIYKSYEKAFANIPQISMNPVPDDCVPNHWLSCMSIDPECKITPEDVIVELEKHNIESRPIWKPMHLQPVFADSSLVTTDKELKGTAKFGDSVSETIFNHGLCLPSDVKNTQEDMDLIISTICRLFA